MADHDPTGAQIIAFPRVKHVAPEDGQERLRRALANLNEAVAGQGAAIAAWRSALADLGSVVAGLSASLHRYRGSLDTLDGRVSALHTQAVTLEQTADRAVASLGE